MRREGQIGQLFIENRTLFFTKSKTVRLRATGIFLCNNHKDEERRKSRPFSASYPGTTFEKAAGSIIHEDRARTPGAGRPEAFSQRVVGYLSQRTHH